MTIASIISDSPTPGLSIITIPFWSIKLKSYLKLGFFFLFSLLQKGIPQCVEVDLTKKWSFMRNNVILVAVNCNVALVSTLCILTVTDIAWLVTFDSIPAKSLVLLAMGDSLNTTEIKALQPSNLNFTFYQFYLQERVRPKELNLFEIWSFFTVINHMNVRGNLLKIALFGWLSLLQRYSLCWVACFRILVFIVSDDFAFLSIL